MINYFSQQFLRFYDETNAVNLLRSIKNGKFYFIGIILAKFLEKQFPNSVNIKDEYAIFLYYIEEYEQSYFMYRKLLKLRGLNEQITDRVLFNQHFCIDTIKNNYSDYNAKQVQYILELPKKPFPMVTFTITSCKRFDLFYKTINSFINCCKDIHIIDEWFCVDDNSSIEERERMKKLYPFINFYYKTLNEKGHPKSMNIIKNYVKTPYIFHMEDDWQFFDKQNYITQCLEVLSHNSSIGQCLINKNYSETPEDYNIKGGVFNTTFSGLRYYIHEYSETEEQNKKFKQKYGNCKRCNYWPHYSLRPSLLHTKIFNEIGDFNEKVSHFEMEYSIRYKDKGYVSAFLEKIYSIHIGRLTSERNNKPNAYDLNNEIQFHDKNEEDEEDEEISFKLKTFIINLDRRQDRWEKIQENNNINFLAYQRFNAIDGNKLKPTSQLCQIFDNNDYNMRKGMVGCAMSHIKLYIDLLKDSEVDTYLIMEDDLDFVTNFREKFLYCIKELDKVDWDLFYLGHHLRSQFIDKKVYSKTLWPKIEQFNRFESLSQSMGGTGAYIINKKGAEKLLEYINITGMTNCIDTIQQKSADTLDVFYSYPHLIYSECCRPENNTDTDIQLNFESLSVPLEKRLEEELKKYNFIQKIDNLEDVTKILNNTDIKPFFYSSKDEFGDDIKKIISYCNFPYYTLEYRILFVCPDDRNGRYFHRFRKNGEWSVDDAIKYD